MALMRALGRIQPARSKLIKLIASRRLLSTQPELPDIAAWPYWTDIWSGDPNLRLNSSLDADAVASFHGGHSSALAEPLMLDGVHEIEFVLTGSCLVGVAAARPDPDIWTGAAWGLDARNGGVLRLASAISGLDAGHAIAPAADDEEQRVLAIVDMVARKLSFVDRDGLVDAHVRLPPAVRPWVCFPAGVGAPASARIVSHRRVAVPTSRVAGLTELVEALPVHTQALALAWCDANGVEDVASIAAAGETQAFAEATRVVVPTDEALVAHSEPWASASAKAWAGWS